MGLKVEQRARNAIRSVLDAQILFAAPTVVGPAQTAFQQAVPEITEQLIRALKSAGLLETRRDDT